MSSLTSSSAIAETPRCRASQFWLKYKWKTTLFSKRCRCQKTKSIDLLHNKSTFIRETVTLRFWALFGGLGATYAVHRRLIGIWKAFSGLPGRRWNSLPEQLRLPDILFGQFKQSLMFG